MPHLVILYTANLEHKTDMTALCRSLADVMLAVRNGQGKPVFPSGGTRVLAYPAAHFAVADGGVAGKAAGGSGDYAFVYMHLRMAKGRSAATHKVAGEAISAAAQTHFATLLVTEHIGITVQIDEGHEVFDAKHSSLHPLFNKA
jgi:5-carboxymethyl-2-hydroxymuconate isomerase